MCDRKDFIEVSSIEPTPYDVKTFSLDFVHVEPRSTLVQLLEQLHNSNAHVRLGVHWVVETVVNELMCTHVLWYSVVPNHDERVRKVVARHILWQQHAAIACPPPPRRSDVTPSCLSYLHS